MFSANKMKSDTYKMHKFHIQDQKSIWMEEAIGFWEFYF